MVDIQTDWLVLILFVICVSLGIVTAILWILNIWNFYKQIVKCFLFACCVRGKRVYEKLDGFWEIEVYKEHGVILKNSEYLENRFKEISQMFSIFIEIFRVIYPEISLRHAKRKKVKIYFLTERTHERFDAWMRDDMRTDGFYMHQLRSAFIEGSVARCDIAREEATRILKHELFHCLCEYYGVTKHISRKQEEIWAHIFETCTLPFANTILQVQIAQAPNDGG